MSGKTEDVTLSTSYAQRLTENKIARKRLAELAESTTQLKSPVTNLVKPSKRQHLTIHLESLRLQRQYTKIQTLSHYSDKVEHIASDKKLYEQVDVSVSHGRLGSQQDHKGREHKETNGIQGQVKDLLTDAKSMTASLELALVKARMQLKREETLLQDIKEQCAMQSDVTVEDVVALCELQALEATRDELQHWIGTGLAKCEQDNTYQAFNESYVMTQSSDRSTISDMDERIETGYQGYIEARRRLLRVAQLLKSQTPLTLSRKLEAPSLTVAEPDVQNLAQHNPRQRPQYLGHRSRTSMMRINDYSSGPSLTAIQCTHLPQYHHEKLVSAHSNHLTKLTQVQDTRLLQMLALLSHESHLLPTYPLPASGSRNEEGTTRSSQQQQEVDSLLRAWAFASEAAKDVLDRNVEKHIADSSNVLSAAGDNVGAMHVVEEMRKEVLNE